MVKNAKKVFKVLSVFCCLLCNLAIATALTRTTEAEKVSRLVLITSFPEKFNANGKLIRKNKVFPLQTLSKTDIDAIAEMPKETATKTLERICDTYIENPLDETNELLYLLNCRKQKDDRILIDRTTNGFKISENYNVSPLKLFFIGIVSNDIDLTCTNVIEQNSFVQNIIEDYTNAIIGKMPIKIVENYSDICLNLLTSEIKASMNQLGRVSQIDMTFFLNSVFSYKDTINKYLVSAYNTEVILAYNLIYNYLYMALDFATSRGLSQLENLVKLNKNVMNTHEKHELSSSEDQSLKKFFNKYKNGDGYDKGLNALNTLLNVMDKLSIFDISNGFVLHKIESNMCASMLNKMELLTEEIKRLFLCLSKLLLYKNN